MIKPEGGEDYEKLNGMQRLDEILDTAINFEQTALNFYNDLSHSVSQSLRSLILELAAQEQRHYDLIIELRESGDIKKVITEKIQTPPNDQRFTEYTCLPDLGENPSDQDVLLYALGREQASMEHYAALAKETPPGPVADLFYYLAHEEVEHKKELEKMYYDVVHNGDV